MADPKAARGVTFTPSAARRIGAVVRQIESTPWSGDPRRGRADRWTPGVMRAKCTTAIPSGTFGSPSSSGEVQIYRLGADGEWAESGDPVKCWNDHEFDDSVASGVTCKVAWIGGQIWLIQADCPG